MRTASGVVWMLWVFIASSVTMAAHGAPNHGGALASQRLSGVAIAEWNQLAYDLAFAEDQFTTFKGQRALAMMHLAQHDALNAIDARYHTYLERPPATHGDPIAAAARAARDVLSAQYPAARSEIDALFAEQIAARAARPSARKNGLEAGRAAARDILRRRQGDGWDVAGVYEFRTGPGMYQTTPDWRGFVVHPGLAKASPFFLKAVSQFRPAPPPPLASRAYARAFEEVKAVGALESTMRTPEQTAYALWWMEFSEGLVNRYLRRRVESDRLELWRTARLFALLNAGLVDTYIAVWDSKYEYNHWRPHTAIREAASDGNTRTASDPTWMSLRPAPPFPEYVSAHAAGCACTFTLLERDLDGEAAVTLDSLTAPGETPERTFISFREAARECADSRVRLGFHFRYATDAGLDLGRRIAHYAARRYLLPKAEGGASEDGSRQGGGD